MFATQYDVAKDGRYVINVNTAQVGRTPITVRLDRGAWRGRSRDQRVACVP